MKITKLQKNIPTGWQEVKLSEISDIKMGQSPLSSAYNGIKKGLPLIQGNNDIKDKKTVGNIWTTEITKTAEKGELILTVRAPVGAIGIAHDKICIGRGVCAIESKHKPFIWHFLNYFEYKWNTLEQGSTFTAVNSSDIKKIKLLLPLLPEQNRIVSVLETWDKSIENLNKKIEIKKQIKKGLMQDLLTGKKRLSGFNDKWETIKLGDIGEFRTSSVDKKTISSEKEALLCNYMDVYKRKIIKNTDIFQKITAKDSQIESSSLIIGDVLFTPSSETPEDIGYSAVVQSTSPNLLFSYHLVRFRPKKNTLDASYSSFCFNQVSFRKYLSSVSAGVTRFTLSKPAFENATVKLPSIKEQNAIAEILTTADREITGLEKKLSIIKDQKKYLLNNLITGVIRTPENLSIK
jgi:type I restriction enzyme S subunit